MVKQRNIFEPNRIDILIDTKENATKETLLSQKEIIEAHNQGIKVVIPKCKTVKPITEAPLFGEVNAKQINLF